ncbi:MAG TPA: universal stress protein [Candidatus Angelobacter sp.]|nr:universal stress protein [Candidatus Angelobacter sp.]
MKPRTADLSTKAGRNAGTEIQLSQILVPVDFSKASRQAVKYAVALAETFDAGLHLLSVVEPVLFMSGLERMPIALPSDAEMVSSAQHDLEELARQEIPATMTATLTVKKGKPPQVIIRAAAKLGVDLIVIPTHGRTGLKRVLLGSTAEQVIRHGPCPVLTLRRRVLARSKHYADGVPTRIKRILVPVDFSTPSLRSLHYAISFAQIVKARLVLLHVVPESIGGSHHVISQLKRFKDQAINRARISLVQLAKQEFVGQVPATVNVTSGVPFDEINRAAEASACDTIIIATHGRTGFKRALMGSTAENVVRYARCPVLVVRAQRRQHRRARSEFMVFHGRVSDGAARTQE